MYLPALLTNCPSCISVEPAYLNDVPRVRFIIKRAARIPLRAKRRVRTRKKVAQPQIESVEEPAPRTCISCGFGVLLSEFRGGTACDVYLSFSLGARTQPLRDGVWARAFTRLRRAVYRAKQFVRRPGEQ